MPSLNHIHSYRRSKSNIEIYQCTHPSCTHYTTRDLLLDKEITCHKCKEVTTATQMQLKAGQVRKGVKYLTCLKCSKSPKKHNVIAMEGFIQDFLGEGKGQE